MCGPTGSEVNQALQGQRDDVRVMNVRRCTAPKKEKKDLKKLSINHCAQNYLWPDIQKLSEVRTILCLGSDALQEVVGMPGITQVFGSVWKRDEVEAIHAAMRPAPVFWRVLPPKLHTVIASLHPAAAMRGSRQYMPTIKQMIARAYMLSQENSCPVGDRLSGLTINIDPTLSDFQYITRHKSKPLSIDIETPDETSTRILCVAVADSPTNTIVFRWREPFITAMKELLEDSERHVLGQNFSFDRNCFVRNLWNGDPRPFKARVYDAMTLSVLKWPVVPNRKAGEVGKKSFKIPFHGLALCRMRLNDREGYWKGPYEQYGKAFYRVLTRGMAIDMEDWLLLYCGLDALKAYSNTLGLKGLVEEPA
jgi:hypothetical protein